MDFSLTLKSKKLTLLTFGCPIDHKATETQIISAKKSWFFLKLQHQWLYRTSGPYAITISRPCVVSQENQRYASTKVLNYF